MKTMLRLLMLSAGLLGAGATAHANSETYCGNSLDDDADGFTDEGCYPDVTLGVCESPLPCATAGAPEPNGGVRLPRPPDLAATVPYGPPLSFERFYTSHYYLQGNGGTFEKPMGPGFQHNYMSWMKAPAAQVPTNAPTVIVLHARTGQDVRFSFSFSDGTWRWFTAQAGVHVKHLRQRVASPYDWDLENLDGTGLTYDWTGSTGLGRMTQIQDSLASPNRVRLAYNAANQVNNVLDATGKRELALTYVSGYLTEVALYENSDTLAAQRLLGLNPATGTKQVSRDYAYTSNRLTSVKQGGTANALESYTWSTSPERVLTVASTSGATATTVVEYVWHSAGTDSGKLARIHTPQGAMGIAVYANPTRQYFYELGLSCTDDSVCTAAEVGSKCHLTERGAVDEGVCFRAYRDVAANTTMADWTPSTVTPGNTLASNGTCTTCNDVDEYSWFTGTSNSDLVLKAVRSSDGVWTSYKLDANGLPTQIVENDTDSDGTTIPASGARVTYLTYGSSSFPALVTERRIKSEIATSGGCTPNDTTACKQTITTYSADGKATAINEKGFTLVQNGTEPTETYDVASFSYTTGYEYDSKGRITAIRGARPVDDDVEFTYFGNASNTASYYLSAVNRRKGASSYLTSTLNDYDFWGNAKRLTDPNAKSVCRTFDPLFGLLASSRRVITGSHTDCTSVGSTDETTSYQYDLYRRLTKTTKPLGNCTTQALDARGRLSVVQNSDLCAGNGDTIQHTYDADGHLTKSEWYQNGSTLMRRQEYTYADDRRVATEVNPIDTSKKKQWLYKDDGVPSELRFEDFVTAGPSTQWDVDALNRTTAERRYNTAGAAETWTITAGVQLLLPKKLRDNASHDIDLVWDDLSRRVKQVTPETGTIVYLRDEAGNLVKRVENVGGVDKKSATFTFDTLNRLVAEDYSDASCGAGQGAEIQYTYDALPSGVTCPASATCNLLAERLAHVKTKIACDAAAADKTFDQATFYSYDNAGRVYQHTVKDDSGRTGTTSYSYDKNSNVLYEVYPSGNYARLEYGSSTFYHSDVDRPHYLWWDTTMLMNNGYYLPWGPIYSQGLMMSFDHGGTMYQVAFAKYRDLAYRPTVRQVQSTYSTPDQVFKIDYGQDARGRITKRDFSYGTSGQVDQFFLYDDLSRVTCRSRTQQSSCPTTGANLMENVSYNSSSDRASIIIKNAALPEQTQTYVYSGTKPEQIASITLSGGGQVNFAYDGRGNRISDDDTNYSGAGDEKREYTYDARNNLITVSGQYLVAANDLNTYVMTNAYDERNRRVFKSFKDTVTNQEAQWFFYYDQWDKLVQATHIPNTASPTNYSIYEWLYVEDEITAYYQLDYVGGSPSSTTRRFLFVDEEGRPHTAWTFPPTGSATRAWEVEAGTWGADVVTLGTAIYQPLRLGGGTLDRESAAVTLAGAELRTPIVVRTTGAVDRQTRAHEPLQSMSSMRVVPLQAFTETGPIAHGPVSGERTVTEYLYIGGSYRKEEEILDACGKAATVVQTYARLVLVDPFGGPAEFDRARPDGTAGEWEVREQILSACGVYASVLANFGVTAGFPERRFVDIGAAPELEGAIIRVCKESCGGNGYKECSGLSFQAMAELDEMGLITSRDRYEECGGDGDGDGDGSPDVPGGGGGRGNLHTSHGGTVL